MRGLPELECEVDRILASSLSHLRRPKRSDPPCADPERHVPPSSTPVPLLSETITRVKLLLVILLRLSIKAPCSGEASLGAQLIGRWPSTLAHHQHTTVRVGCIHPENNSVLQRLLRTSGIFFLGKSEVPFRSACPRACPDMRGKEVHRPGMEHSRSNADSRLLSSRGGHARKNLPSTTFRQPGLSGATFAYHPNGAAAKPARRAPERHAVASQTL